MDESIRNQEESKRLLGESRRLLLEQPLLRKKLCRALFCNPSESEQALGEVLKFIALAAEYRQGPLTPSIRVDMAWHEFLLFTRLYSRYCENNFGRTIHHEPSDDTAANSRQYAETLRLYRRKFGEPPSEYWGRTGVGSGGGAAAFCGGCEAGNV